MDKPPVPVSVLVPIKNEAATLERCLRSVAWADEIIVVDSNSTDGSQAIAERLGAKVVQFQFNGVWPKKRNWALANIPFKHEWVFVFDADEVMPEGAAEEFRRIATGDDQGCNGFWINRRFMFMGRWLKHAYFPNWNMRLFRHKVTRYERLTEGNTSSGDNEVHEPVLVEGRTGFLKVQMDHYAFPSVDVFVEKHNRYSNWEAHVALDGHLNASPALKSGEDFNLRRRLKRLSMRLPFRPLLRFLYVYVWQRGFLDGLPGYYFARMHGVYELLSVAKTYELKRAHAARNQPGSPHSCP